MKEKREEKNQEKGRSLYPELLDPRTNKQTNEKKEKTWRRSSLFLLFASHQGTALRSRTE